MEYRSIMFSKSEKWPLALIKYTEEYKKHLERIRRFNKELADSVENCSKVYSETSEHQSYMIFLGENYCVGAIYIGTSFDEKKLELEIHFDEKYIELPNEIYEITEYMVDSLAYYFPDKERIEVKLRNKADLSSYNKRKYVKIVYNANLVIYSCKNKYYQELNKQTLGTIHTRKNKTLRK